MSGGPNFSVVIQSTFKILQMLICVLKNAPMFGSITKIFILLILFIYSFIYLGLGPTTFIESCRPVSW